jgi:diaminohydroxyphosphoribosylaminopyrimidine deaminase/5-amino-6-(5-phosphoribosylamino)uracil reductase
VIVEEKYMHRCLQLAKLAQGNTTPNPMVGAVVVRNDAILGEGYHMLYGAAHAEPNAINSVKDASLLTDSTLYVNLEPCSHFGKTPPCAALIIRKKIPRVVIGSIDPNPLVAGRGIKMMQDAGIEVVTGVLDAENRELNKRFFTFQEKKRPFILLKWAQSVDGFIDGLRADASVAPTQFSTPATQVLNHKTRAEEAAILVGTRTVLMDNPKLTIRLWKGNNPLRVIIDKSGLVEGDFHVLDNTAPTLIFSETEPYKKGKTERIKIDFSQSVIPQILQELYKRQIDSLIVEGGNTLLQSFIDAETWDEARVELAPFKLNEGIPAPKIPASYFESELSMDGNKFLYYKR